MSSGSADRPSPGSRHADVDLPALIENCAASRTDAADRRGIDLRIDIDPFAPAYVLADGDALRAAVCGLLDAVLEAADGGLILLHVRRNGYGTLGPHLLVRVEAPETRSSAPFPPSGYALAAERLGGEAGFDAPQGAGLVGWFEVELAEGSPPASPARVLLAEDLAMSRELVAAVLRSAGHRVDVAGDGAEAIAAVADAARDGAVHDIILMDLQMPGTDGLAATRAIRAMGGTSAAVPIVGMTAEGETQRWEECRAAGMTQLVGKPVERAALLALVAGHAPPPFRREGATIPPPLDGAVLRRLEAVHGHARVADTVARFLDEIEPRLGRLDGTSGMEALGREAHALAGQTGTLGLARASQAFRRLMDACETRDFGDLARLVQDAENALMSGASALRQAYPGLASEAKSGIEGHAGPADRG